jgi:hypothetical protein
MLSQRVEGLSKIFYMVGCSYDLYQHIVDVNFNISTYLFFEHFVY